MYNCNSNTIQEERRETERVVQVLSLRYQVHRCNKNMRINFSNTLGNLFATVKELNLNKTKSKTELK